MHQGRVISTLFLLTNFMSYANINTY